MGRFSKIADAKVTPSGQYFKEGNYTVKIEACKYVESQADRKEFFIIEPGTDRSHVINMNQVMGNPNMKQFVAAASGVDPYCDTVNDLILEEWKRRLGEPVDMETICELIVSSANPLEGQVMKLECTVIQKRSDGEDFTKHNWQPYEGGV